MKQAIPQMITIQNLNQKGILLKNVFFCFQKNFKNLCKNDCFLLKLCYNTLNISKANRQLQFLINSISTVNRQLKHVFNIFMVFKSKAFSCLFLSCVSATKKKPKLNLKGGFLFMRSFIDSTIRKQNETKNCDIQKISENSARYRTINATIKELKEIDPNTCISTYFIRCLCNSKKVLSLTAGTKVLVNFDDLLNYLQKGER